MKNLILTFLLLTTLQSCFGSKDSPTKEDSSNVNKPTIVVDDGIIGSLSTTSTSSWSVLNNVDHYEISIGSEKGKNDIKDWIDVGNTNSTFLNSENLIKGNKYFTNIRALNQNNDIIAEGSGDGWIATDNWSSDITSFSVNDFVNSIEFDNDDNKYIAGNFNSISPTSVNKIVSLSTNGILNANKSFAATSGGNILKLSSGKYIFYSFNKNYNNQTTSDIIRLNTNGTIDTTFILDPSLSLSSTIDVKEISNGELLVMYYSTIKNNYTIARLNINGTSNSSFTTNLDSNGGIFRPISMTVTGNKFYVNSYDFTERYNIDGTYDTTFSSFYNTGNVLQLSDSNLITFNSNFLHLYNSAQIEDTSFLTNTRNAQICNPSKVIEKDSTSYYVLYIDCTTSKQKISIVKRDGTIDSAFETNIGSGTRSNDSIVDIIKDASGNLIAYGYINTFNDQIVSKNIVRLKPNGTIDTSFITSRTGFDDFISSVSLDGSEIIVSGQFSRFGGNASPPIIKLNKNNIPVGFSKSISINGTISEMKLFQNHIYIIGDFNKVNGKIRNKIAKLNLDGSLSNDFNYSGFEDSAYLSGIRFFKDNKILIFGQFNKYNNVTAKNIVKILSDGSIDSTFTTGSGFNSSINDVAIQSNNEIIAIGSFTRYRNVNISKIVRLKSNGSLDLNYLPGTNINNFLQSLAILDDDSLLACGHQIGMITKITKEGFIANDFDFSNGQFYNGSCYKILKTKNNDLTVSGLFFSTYPNQEYYLLAINNDGSIKQNLGENIVDGINYMNSFSNFSNDGKFYIGGSFVNGNQNHYIKIFE